MGAGGIARWLFSWDAAAVVYMGAVLVMLWGADPDRMKRRAEELDEDQWTILLLSVTASLASIAAVALDLAGAKGTGRAEEAALLAGATILVSWTFVQVLYAHHYAHAYWLRGEGLDFPGNEEPDFPEFLYFAMTVGMTAQVSDVTTQSAAMRRLVLGHSILSFLFNAVVVAAAVNLAAALVG
nr:DUF1345 domain-containing protein [Pararoseomonas indoligenes]